MGHNWRTMHNTSFRKPNKKKPPRRLVLELLEARLAPANQATAIALSTSGLTSVYGQSVQLTTTVTVPPPGAGTPGGTVTFKDNGTPIGTGNLNGVSGNDQAIFTTSALAVGTHHFTAVYDGDSNFAGSASDGISDTSGLALWLRADAGVTADSSGNVSAWADQSGNGHGGTTAGFGNDPRLVPNALNGQPALAFDGTDVLGLANGQVLTSQ
jgi:hypothetical protein